MDEAIAVFSAVEMIKDVERKYSIVSINIDIDTQTCTVKRKNVLSWGADNCCTSTSYEDLVLTGKEFFTVISKGYDILCTELDTYMVNKGI